MAQAESTLTKARQYLERAQTVRPGAVSATDLDDAVAEELRARAQLEEAKASLQIAEINLGYTTVTAPISGRIGKTRYTKGNLADSASGPLAKIVQLDPIRVIYSVSENDLATIQMALHDAREGKKSPTLTPRLKLANAEILKTTGRVEFVDNQVDPATGTIAVWALFDNPDGNLLPGQYVTVMITRSEPKMMPVIPQPAILVNQQGRYVLVVDKKNRAVARPITTGPAIGSSWAVESGLAAGEKVIVQGIQKVRPGQTVQINPGKAQGR